MTVAEAKERLTLLEVRLASSEMLLIADRENPFIQRTARALREAIKELKEEIDAHSRI